MLRQNALDKGKRHRGLQLKNSREVSKPLNFVNINLPKDPSPFLEFVSRPKRPYEIMLALGLS